MNRNITTIFFAGLLLLASSCSFLDVELQDDMSEDESYSTEANVNMALNGVYATLGEVGLYYNYMLSSMGLSADIGYDNSSKENTVGIYDVVPSDSKILTYWRNLYDGINRANLLLANIDQAKDLTAEKKDNIYAQALFLRGYFHFMLVVRFQNICVMTEPYSDLTKGIKQSTAREAYLQIIKDMETAAPLLKPAAELMSPGTVSQSTAYGMLSRVALYMAGYPIYEPGMYAKAKSYAQKVIDAQYHELNPSFEQFFINLIQDKYDPKESLFEVEFWGNNEGSYTSTAGMVGRNNGIKNTDETVLASGITVRDTYGYSNGGLLATPYLVSLFEEGDLRRDWTAAPYLYKLDTEGNVNKSIINDDWGRYCGKFRREYELAVEKSLFSPINFPILRYAEVLLNWAEAVAADPENNDASDLAMAHTYLNQVRRRGYGFEVNTPNIISDIEQGTKSALYEVLKEERARELGFELMRKDDIVRWGEFYSRMNAMRGMINQVSSSVTISYYQNARLYFNNFKSCDEFWPIPSYELGLNPNMKQNVGF